MERVTSVCFAVLFLCSGPTWASRNAKIIRNPDPVLVLSSENTQSTDGDDLAPLIVAGRQRLFDFGLQQGLDVLYRKVGSIVVPDYRTELNFPILGPAEVTVRNIQFEELDVPPETTSITIESGYYHLHATNLAAKMAFDWKWTKSGLSGSGQGDLSLTGGAVDLFFIVKNQEAGTPAIHVVSSSVLFDTIDVNIHSFKLDWLYQAFMMVFGGAIKQEIEESINMALRSDVPSALNDMLATLPAEVMVQGLPFHMVFSYAIYTLSYVMVRGYGEVATDARLAALNKCPIPASPNPVPENDIRDDARMVSLYMHQSVFNCILWGLQQEGVLHKVVKDGDVPNVRLVTDLFTVMIPDISKIYPHKSMELQMTSSRAPLVSFSAKDGLEVNAVYRTKVVVLDALGGGQHVQVAELTANLSFTADVNWRSTRVKTVDVQYGTLMSTMPVNEKGWNGVVSWVLKQAGGKLTLGHLVDVYVNTPVTPYFGMVDSNCTAMDEWYAISTDIATKKPLFVVT